METTNFGLCFKYDTGNNPDVAINKHNQVAEIHKSNTTNRMYYRVGKVDNLTIHWYDGDHRFEGQKPRIALSDSGVAMFVYERAGTGKDKTLYGIGNLDMGKHTINWGDVYEFSGGVNPDVDLFNERGEKKGQHVAIVAHEEYDGADGMVKIFCRSVVIDGSSKKTVDNKWHILKGSGDKIVGYGPRVSVNDGGYVALLYSSRDAHDLYCYIGLYDFDTHKVKWGPRQSLEKRSCNYSIAVTNDNTVVVAFSGQKSKEPLFTMTGSFKSFDTPIAWGKAIPYDEDGTMGIDASIDRVVQVNGVEFSAASTDARFSITTILDSSNWMTNNWAIIKGRKLEDLVLPASHDSGMYTSPERLDGFTITQNFSIGKQLEWGIRFFDLRVMYEDKKFFIHHNGHKGPPLTDVLNDVAKFCSSGNRTEFAILKFSDLKYFGDRTSMIFDKFIGEIDNKLKNHLVRRPLKAPWQGGKITKAALRDLMVGNPLGSTILTVYKDIENITPSDTSLDKAPYDAAWLYYDGYEQGKTYNQSASISIFDQYSNKINFSEMRNDQQEKWEKFKSGKLPNEYDLFLLSWTQTGWIVDTIADDANKQLCNYINNYIDKDARPLPNLLYVDFIEQTRVTELAVLMNQIWGKG